MHIKVSWVPLLSGHLIFLHITELKRGQIIPTLNIHQTQEQSSEVCRDLVLIARSVYK